jgi:UDPglucose 6-dehydrogenase
LKITVYGAGYVGLVAAACFAEAGHDVLAVDPDPKRLASLNAGRVPFVEAGLDALVAKGIASRRLTFSGDLETAAAFSNMHFLAVGTPSAADGSTDETQLIAAAHAIGRGAVGDVVVVVKSTAPVGAAERVADEVRHELSQRGVGFQAEVVVNPEFLRAGSAVKDFFEPDRVVVGGESSGAVAAVASLYTPFVAAEKILTMDAASASLVKYAANAMLATRVSFMNELANLAEALGADIEGVRRGLGADPRIGSQYLSPGMGYGGSCLPKDVASLIAVGEVAGVTMGVARAVAEANDVQPHRITDKLERHLGDLAGRVIAVWGIAFKAGTDDMRDAPSRILITDLLTAGATVRAFDPAAGVGAKALYEKEHDVTIVGSAAEALQGADALAIAADWPEFREVSPDTILAALSEPLVVDGRNLFDPVRMREAGITYCGVGRGDA